MSAHQTGTTSTARATPLAPLFSRARNIVISSHPLAVTRQRLILMNMLVVSGILAIMAISVYAWELHASDQQVNDQLTHAVTLELQSDLIVTLEHKPQSEDNDAADEVAQYQPSSPNVFIVGLDPSGHVVFDPGHVRAHDVPDLSGVWPVLRGKQTTTLVTIGDDATAYRLYTVPVKSHGQIIGVLQVGQSLASRERELADLRIILLCVGAGVLFLAGFASLYLAGRALRPLQLAYERQHQFAAAASHELRTPLAIVRSQAELVERALHRASSDHTSPDGDPAKRLEVTETDVADILTEVDYMTRLIRDLLVLARDEGDHRSIANDTINLSNLIAQTVRKMMSQAETKGISLQLEEETPIPPDGSPAIYVRGDEDRLRQLILVLLENAVRYTDRGGSIQVSCTMESGRRFLIGHRQVAQLTVMDTGKGIPPEALPHIFEPFYRASADTDHQSGAGLGLALARWIVAAHGGEIIVDSELGVGTGFTVLLPLASRSSTLTHL